MLRSRLLPLGLASAVALTLAACQDNSNPTAPDAGPPSDRVQASQGADLPPASEFARQVPGFGGFFLDRSGNPTLYLTRGSSRGSRRAVAGRVSRSARTHDRRDAGCSKAVTPGTSSSGGRLRQVPRRWPCPAQSSWTTTRPATGSSSGCENLSATGQVRAALARLGIPDEAVIVERADPIVQVATLQNVVDRPVRAGVQINFPGFLCTRGLQRHVRDSEVLRHRLPLHHDPGRRGEHALLAAAPEHRSRPRSPPRWRIRSTRRTSPDARREAVPLQRCLPGRLHQPRQPGASARSPRPAGPTTGASRSPAQFTITADDCATRGGCLTVGTTVNKVGRTTGLDRRRHHQHLRQHRGQRHPYRPALPDLRVGGSGRRATAARTSSRSRGSDGEAGRAFSGAATPRDPVRVQSARQRHQRAGSTDHPLSR